MTEATASENLPAGSAPAPVESPYFPTRWQHFLWRNWGLVPAETLAGILACSPAELTAAAAELGLPPEPEVSGAWRERGYLTLIRNNWHLLNYRQLLQLLDWPAEKLAYTLKEEDFCFYKLGQLKPDCPELRYAPLTSEQRAATREIEAVMRRYFPAETLEYADRPFAFADRYHPMPRRSGKSEFAFNFIHSYAASCGDVLGGADVSDPVPESLLAQYASMGIAGVWMHALLYLLCPIPGAEEYSAGFRKRLDNLREIVRRCGRYGIKVYLYLNEPRALPPSFYDRKPHWGGREARGTRTVCIRHSPEPLQWLETALRSVFTAVPELGGVLTITMSENPTHCNFDHHREACPYCRDTAPERFIAAVNAAVERGMHAAAPGARMLIFDWAWRSGPGTGPATDFKCGVLDLLPKHPNVFVTSVSEWGLPTRVGGVEQHVVDYSISQVGPAAEAEAVWAHARRIGLGVCAKLQINNSWELSAVPYIPVPYLIREHLDKLKRAGADGLMLSWTLGGFPGGNLELLDSTPEEIAAAKFRPELAARVCAAWRKFSEAFREFPFHMDVVYNAPVNFGPMNVLHLRSTGYRASMIGFPYDDLASWRGVYPEDVFAAQWEKLTAGWRDGLEILRRAKALARPEEMADFTELETVAQASYCHLRSTCLQTAFVLARDRGFDRARMRECAREELALARELHGIARRDSRIGFEASNHYYYTLNDLREKVVNCAYILRQLER